MELRWSPDGDGARSRQGPDAPSGSNSERGDGNERFGSRGQSRRQVREGRQAAHALRHRADERRPREVVKPIGEFVWHKHDDTDELFFVHKGHLVIHYRDREVHLRAGEMHVVPRSIKHKPFAESECEVLLIEPAGTLNTGDAGGALTAAQKAWI